MDPELIAAAVLAFLNVLTGGAWALDRRRLKGQTAEAEGSLAGVITVNEANRRATAARLEAERAAAFAALLKAVEDHHKDDATEFARVDAEVTRLRDHRHEFDTWRTRMEFQLDEVRRELGLVTDPGRPLPQPPRARPGRRG